MVLEELDGNVGVGVGGDARAGVGKTRIIIDGDGAAGATSRADVSARRSCARRARRSDRSRGRVGIGGDER